MGISLRKAQREQFRDHGKAQGSGLYRPGLHTTPSSLSQVAQKKHTSDTQQSHLFPQRPTIRYISVIGYNYSQEIELVRS